MARTSLLQDILDSLGHDEVSRREVRVISRSYGICSPPITLREIAAEEGVSAERIRQIIERGRRRMAAAAGPDGDIRLSGMVERANQALLSLAPARNQEATPRLRQEGLIAEDEEASMLASLISLCTAASVTTEMIRGDSWICPSWLSGRIETVRIRAASLNAAIGCFSDLSLSLDVSQFGMDIAPSDIRAMVPDYTLMGVVSGESWFAGASARRSAILSRAIRYSRIARKSFSIDAIYAFGPRTLDNIPREVLRSVLRHHGAVVHDDDTMDIAGEGAGNGILGSMISLLGRLGGRIELSAFIDQCERNGIRKTTARMYSKRQGIFVREGSQIVLDPGVA